MHSGLAYAVVFLLIAAEPFTNLGAQDNEGYERPNIIVIMADDHGQWASAVYGNQHLTTPNMNWLANQGAVFQQAYAVSPVCSPARASFFTGRMPSQHGVHDFLSETPTFDYPWLKHETLLSSLLQTAGYRTALIGKWHATTNSAKPQSGFDYWLSYDVEPAGWQNQYQHQGRVHFSEQGKKISTKGYQTPALTDKALDFIGSIEQGPFFLFLGYVDTHAPFDNQPPVLVDPLLKKKLTPSADQEKSTSYPRSPNNRVPDNHHEQLAQYLAGVEMMDQQIGRIIDYLKLNNLIENTLIVYTSDHGHMNGHHGLYGKGNATSPQNFYQESIMVPLSLTWPKVIEAGKRYSQPVGTCDLFQTILDAGQVLLAQPVVESINSPGSSVLNLLDQPTAPWPKYKFCEMGNARMIADDNFKYIIRFPPLVKGTQEELYHLKEDPRERYNQVQEPAYQQELHRLKEQLNSYFEKYQEKHHSGTNLAAQPPANGNEQWRDD